MTKKLLNTEEKKLPKAQQQFVENMADPSIKNQTEAYQKAYKSSNDTARANAPRLLANASISDAIKERKRQALAHSKVTPEEILGSAVFQMRSSIDDLLDDDGSLSLEKARQTGAIHLIKKLKKTTKKLLDSKGNITETISTIEVEMLTNQDGRREVAKYMEVELLAPKPELIYDDPRYSRELLKRLIHDHGWDPEQAISGILQRFPELDEKMLRECVEADQLW